MSTNCLVKKLKGIVNDDNLPIFDAVKISILKSATTPDEKALSFRVESTGEITIKTDSSHVFYINDGSGVSEWTGELSWSTIKAQNDNYNIIIKSKKLVGSFGNAGNDGLTEHNYGFNITDIEYCNDTLTVSNNSNIYGKVRRINASSFAIDNTNAFVDLSDVIFEKYNAWFGSFSVYNTQSKGDISENASFIRMLATNTNTGEVRLNFESTSITGNSVNFANALVAAGKTSGVIRMFITGTSITSPTGNDSFYIKFGSSMENPTAEETAQGYQFV